MSVLFLRLMIWLIRSMPTLWVGWTLKTLVAWYYGPHSKLGAANPGNTILNWIVWTGLACFVLMIAQGFAPDGSISKALGNIQYVIFRVLRSGWKVTATKWEEAGTDAPPTA